MARSVSTAPMLRVRLDLFRLTPVTGTGWGFGSETVTVQVAVFPPSLVAAVMTAVPAVLAVTRPVLETEATSGRSLFHRTFLSEASSGCTMARSVSAAPMLRVRLDLFRLTPETGTGTGSGGREGEGSAGVGAGVSDSEGGAGDSVGCAVRGAGPLVSVRTSVSAARAAGVRPAAKSRARQADRSRFAACFIETSPFLVFRAVRRGAVQGSMIPWMWETNPA